MSQSILAMEFFSLSPLTALNLWGPFWGGNFIITQFDGRFFIRLVCGGIFCSFVHPIIRFFCDVDNFKWCHLLLLFCLEYYRWLYHSNGFTTAGSINNSKTRPNKKLPETKWECERCRCSPVDCIVPAIFTSSKLFLFDKKSSEISAPFFNLSYSLFCHFYLNVELVHTRIRTRWTLEPRKSVKQSFFRIEKTEPVQQQQQKNENQENFFDFHLCHFSLLRFRSLVCSIVHSLCWAMWKWRTYMAWMMNSISEQTKT